MKRNHPSARRFLFVGLCLLGIATIATTAEAKPWKGSEMITQQTFRYGAFEARIRAARGSGMITPFFLYKDNSEIAGGQWEELDFEIFGKDGRFQTQAMTPGKNGAPRTEHVLLHDLPTAAWDHYYTYRMEWTPTQLSFYIDGQLIRRETDAVEFAKLMDPNQAEAMRLRVSLWAGDYDWSGLFDQASAPGAMFVNWIQVYSFTPGAGPNGGDFTLLWRDDLDATNSSRWYWANWTFDVAINDYIAENSAARNGYLVQVLTADTATGQFPAAPIDDGSIAQAPGAPPPTPTTPIAIPGRIEAEAAPRAFDTTPSNLGDAACGAGPVDAQLTADAGGGCNVGFTDAGEWMEYDVSVAQTAVFDLSLRVASGLAGQTFHIALDGQSAGGGAHTVDVSDWQTFETVGIPNLTLTAGPHVLRLVFDTGYINVNYLEFALHAGGSTTAASSCAPTSTTYQAETMSPSTGGPIANGWNIWSNGSLSTSHPFQGGSTRIRVSAAGQVAAGVWPHMIVRIGDLTIGDGAVTTTAFASYPFTTTVATAGPQAVSISFDNDYLANGEDRNLLIDALTIDECPAPGAGF
jgi:endo-1,3-1,4-beta-glycanase ExoK